MHISTSKSMKTLALVLAGLVSVAANASAGHHKKVQPCPPVCYVPCPPPVHTCVNYAVVYRWDGCCGGWVIDTTITTGTAVQQEADAKGRQDVIAMMGVKSYYCLFVATYNITSYDWASHTWKLESVKHTAADAQAEVARLTAAGKYATWCCYEATTCSPVKP